LLRVPLGNFSQNTRKFGIIATSSKLSNFAEGRSISFGVPFIRTTNQIQFWVSRNGNLLNSLFLRVFEHIGSFKDIFSSILRQIPRGFQVFRNKNPLGNSFLCVAKHGVVFRDIFCHFESNYYGFSGSWDREPDPDFEFPETKPALSSRFRKIGNPA